MPLAQHGNISIPMIYRSDTFDASLTRMGANARSTHPAAIRLRAPAAAPWSQLVATISDGAIGAGAQGRQGGAQARGLDRARWPTGGGRRVNHRVWHGRQPLRIACPLKSVKQHLGD